MFDLKDSNINWNAIEIKKILSLALTDFLESTKKAIFGIAGIVLLVLGEEISWGQQIFGWDSFGVFNEYNYQNETNAHNFLNPYIKFIYPVVGMG